MLPFRAAFNCFNCSFRKTNLYFLYILENFLPVEVTEGLSPFRYRRRPAVTTSFHEIPALGIARTGSVQAGYRNCEGSRSELSQGCPAGAYAYMKLKEG